MIQQVTTLDCNLYWEASAVFPILNLLDPTIGQHDLQIPGQGGWVEAQTLPNLDTSNGASLCYKNQKIRLACFQAEWTEFSIVDTREHTIKFAHAHQQALMRDLINDLVTVIHPGTARLFSTIAGRSVRCLILKSVDLKSVYHQPAEIPNDPPYAFASCQTFGRATRRLISAINLVRYLNALVNERQDTSSVS